MKGLAILVALLLCLSAVASIHELPMQHRKRTPSEAKRFIEYMNRGPLMTRVNKLLAKVFPSSLTPNIYAYPEVKILNYLDAQYYGYCFDYLVKSTSALLPNRSEWCSTLDLPTCGCPRRSADCLPPATSTNTSTPPRAAPTSTTAPTSTSPTAQEQSPDSSDRTPPLSLDSKPRTPSSPKSPSSTESASSPPNSTESSAWPGHQSQSTACPSSSTSSTSRESWNQTPSPST